MKALLKDTAKRLIPEFPTAETCILIGKDVSPQKLFTPTENLRIQQK